MFITWPAIKSRSYTMEFEIPISKTQKFWNGLHEGKVYATKCDNCGELRFPPVTDCPDCSSSQVSWFALNGRGVVEAFTHVIARPTSFQNQTPYTIVISNLIDGVKVLAWLRDEDAMDVEIGMKVKLVAGVTPEGEASYWFVPNIE